MTLDFEQLTDEQLQALYDQITAYLEELLARLTAVEIEIQRRQEQ